MSEHHLLQFPSQSRATEVRSGCSDPMNRFIPIENKAGIILNKGQDKKSESAYTFLFH